MSRDPTRRPAGPRSDWVASAGAKGRATGTGIADGEKRSPIAGPDTLTPSVDSWEHSPMSTAARYLTALMFVLTLSSAPAWAQDRHNRLVFFGDSLSDPGNYYLAFGQVSQAPFAPIP